MTCSTVQVLRDKQTMECASLAGLYPCGEGAGYAGGIMSAAVDGMKVGRALGARLRENGSRVGGVGEGGAAAETGSMRLERDAR